MEKTFSNTGWIFVIAGAISFIAGMIMYPFGLPLVICSLVTLVFPLGDI
jgi:tellurite resistance protein TehA-like permease